MSKELIQEIDHLRAEIQQLKEQLKDITAVELKLGELQAIVEAAKNILLKTDGSYDSLILARGKLRKVLAGETKDPLEKALPKTELPNGWDKKWSSIINERKP